MTAYALSTRAGSVDRQCAQRGLDEHDDVERRQGTHLLGGLGLRQHHGRVVGARQGLMSRAWSGVPTGLTRTTVRPGSSRVVQERSPRGLPVPGRHAVLEVEDDHVGRGRGLLEPLGAVSGAEQPAGPDLVPAPSGTLLGGGRLRTMVFRDAVATTSPCWLRPVCANVTMPSPGLLFDSRLSVTSVSA